jgi:hypothetical protein
VAWFINKRSLGMTKIQLYLYIFYEKIRLMVKFKIEKVKNTILWNQASS